MKVFAVASILALAIGTFSMPSTAATPPATLGYSADDELAVRMLASAVTEEGKSQSVLLALAPIHSAHDLSSYLRTQEGQAGPLSLLAPDARRRFVRSLTFNDSGITGFNYSELAESGLTATDAYKLLALFGVERTTSMIKSLVVETELDRQIMSLKPTNGLIADDYVGYQCFSRKSCAPDPSAICTRNC